MSTKESLAKVLTTLLKSFPKVSTLHQVLTISTRLSVTREFNNGVTFRTC